MQPVLTADEYVRIDKAYDGDLIEAMDRAGNAVALAAVGHGATYGRRVVVLAGPGNNGGDGYVAARYLKQRGAAVEVHSLAEPRTPEALDALNRARAAGVHVRSLGPLTEAHLVVDALFGGGVRGELPREVRSWIDTPAPVVAVDYPTGLDPNTGVVDDVAFTAVETVTFSTLKTGHLKNEGPDRAGSVTVVDVGINGGRPSMFVAEESDATRPLRSRTDHKWSAGAVLVVGGSSGIIGASVFAARSALNFGAGSVVVASPNASTAHQIAPEVPTFELDQAKSRLGRFDVLVVGPGLADHDVDDVIPLAEAASRLVLDAGALDNRMIEAAVAGDAEVIVTPHMGEYRRLTGGGGGSFSIRAFARSRGVTVLLKGNPTQISDGGLPVLVTSGGSELATIGTGDVLAGMIGALWARGLEATEAAVSGAYWHGRAARELSRSRNVTAQALVEHIPFFAW